MLILYFNKNIFKTENQPRRRTNVDVNPELPSSIGLPLTSGIQFIGTFKCKFLRNFCIQCAYYPLGERGYSNGTFRPSDFRPSVTN